MNRAHLKAGSASFRFAVSPLALACAAAFAVAPAWAVLPVGPNVVSGTAGIATVGNQMTITNSPNAVINWQGFSVGSQNSVYFQQQSASSKVLNRVVGNDPSQIQGNLGSNGGVWLVNPNGILFGENARINVAGLVASSLDISNTDFLGNRFNFIATNASQGAVDNKGEIRTVQGGRVWLLGDTVSNSGLVDAPGGNIVVAAGSSVELVDSGLPNIVVKVAAPTNSAVNLGRLTATGGTIDVRGGIVNQQGVIRADSVGIDAAGQVVLQAQGNLTLGDASQTSASAAATGTGGTVVAQSQNGTTLVSGQVAATSVGGAGGQVQVLGQKVGVYRQALVDASGATAGGKVLVGGDYQGNNPAIQNASVTYLGNDASLKANATQTGDGGRVIVWGTDTNRTYGTIEARGGPGGQGGFVETSGGYLDAQPKAIDVTAPGGKAGTWLLDPNNITISDSLQQNNVDMSATPLLTTSNDNAVVNASVLENLVNAGANVIVQTGFAGSNTQAGDITVASNISLAGTTYCNCTYSRGGSSSFTPPGSLTLTANRNIIFNPGAQITSYATGSAIVVNAGGFINNSGGPALSAPNGKFLVYLTSPDGNAFGALSYDYVLFNAQYSPSVVQQGNGLLYSVPLNVLASVTKTYDGNNAVTIGTNNTIFNGLPAGYTVQTNQSALFSDKNVGTNKTITLVPNGSNFNVQIYDSGSKPVFQNQTPISYLGTILPRSLTLSGSITAQDKVYDGTTTATLNFGALSGVISGDLVSLNSATGNFSDKNVGTNKTVNLSGGSLTGTDAGNYNLNTVAFTTTGNITPKGIAANGIAALDKAYDGTTTATLNFGALSGVVSGDAVSLSGATGNFSDKNVGTNKTVTLSGGNLTGADAGNYNLSAIQASTTANITEKLALVTLVGSVSRVYDATSNAILTDSLYALSGLIGAEKVSVHGPSQGQFDNPNVGTQKLVSTSGAFQLIGADASNYKLSANSASGNIGTITPATLTYVANPSLGIIGVPVTGLSGQVSGFLGADSLSNATSGTLNWTATATTTFLVGPYSVNGGGLSAPNYIFQEAPSNAVALKIIAPNTPSSPQQQLSDTIVGSIANATQAATALVYRGAQYSVTFDSSLTSGSTAWGAQPGSAFGQLSLSLMSWSDLEQIVEERHAFKEKLFADVIYSLNQDPSLANIPICKTTADVMTGTCEPTVDQREALIRQAAPQATVRNSVSASLPQIERKIAVLFGINEYRQKGIPALETAVPDAEAVGKQLAEKLGYEVRVIKNATKADIIRSLNELAIEAKLGDSVTVYFAGHGYLSERSGAGYWIPADASTRDAQTWISNSDVSRLLSGIQAKQVAVLSDSCYSGAFANEEKVETGTSLKAAALLSKRSVVVMSSGGEEPVSDEGKEGHSIFAWSLLQALGGVKEWQPGNTIFTEVRQQVKQEFPQVPQYGALVSAGHQQGGDYLFEQRQLGK